MSLIAPRAWARHHGGIAQSTDPGTRPDEAAAEAGHRPGPPWRHAPQWTPPEWMARIGHEEDHLRHKRHLMRVLRLRSLRRNPESRVLGGVCAAVADRTGVDVTVVRIATVLFAIFTVMGALVYAAAWLLIPIKGESSTIFARAINDRRGIRIVVALIPVLIVLQIVISELHIGLFGLLSWPAFLAGGLGILIWRNAAESERRWIEASVLPIVGAGSGRTSRWVLLTRVGVGVAMAVGGVVILSSGHATAAALRPVGGAALVMAAFVVTFGPWWLSLVKDLMSERRARALAEERTQMAAHVHDSVLQTLALIQRASDDPQQIVRLARAQERELRAWLFEGRPPGAISEEVASLAEGVALVQRHVEADHGITVQVVVVGDCALDDALRALLDAAKEATVNAAKWSGADQVSVFAEVEGDRVMLFVRDRGRGFDPTEVPEDRQGIAQSIRARIERAGGTVEIRSAPGEGAEVALSMPRHEPVT